jgi:hypothetical protein
MAEFKIDRGIPMPSRARNRRIYPLGGMEIGDSFFAPEKSGQRISGLFSRFAPRGFRLEVQ